MLQSKPGLLEEIRSRFAHVETCPFQGRRIFFENAGGALTLNSVVESSAKFAAIPDNQGRDNVASSELMRIIAKMRADTMELLGASTGQVFIGESGTELLFRMIGTAILATPEGGNVVGSTLEHPASRSPCDRWAGIAGKDYVAIPHDDETGTIEAAAYARHVTEDTRVATIIHTSPVTGMSVDVAAIASTIRKTAPDCIIIVDGIQHAAHGGFDVDSYGIDGYAISPYKVFSRHGYGVAWMSPRLSALPHNSLVGGAPDNWELGTRDTGAYATFSDVVEYLDWLGSAFSDSTNRRDRLLAAAQAIHAHEKTLTDTMLRGTGNLKGLADLDGIEIIGGVDNPRREGVVSFTLQGLDGAAIVEKLSEQGIRAHIRKADHYSGNILEPLGLPNCVRISLCHYNTEHEVKEFLAAMAEIASASA